MVIHEQHREEFPSASLQIIVEIFETFLGTLTLFCDAENQIHYVLHYPVPNQSPTERYILSSASITRRLKSSFLFMMIEILFTPVYLNCSVFIMLISFVQSYFCN